MQKREELKERLTNLIKRLKRDYPNMMSIDIAELIIEELEDLK